MPRTIPPKDRMASGGSFKEYGVAGVSLSSGYVQDELLRELQGDRGRKIYREMADNDDTVGAILFALEMLIRAVVWDIESNTTEGDDTPITPEQEEAINWLHGVLFEDMENTWDEFIGEALSFLTYGWAYMEVVFKLRNGNDLWVKPGEESIFNDGRIGIKKIANRSQLTLDKWEIGPKGEILGMWQRPPDGQYNTVLIPKSKCLHFRTRENNGNPEGRSILRNAYRPWFFLKRIQEFEAIGIERDLHGLPIARIPKEILGGTSSAAQAVRETYVKMVRDVKSNSQAGVVIPSDTFKDADGKPTTIRQVDFELLSTNGSRAIDTDTTVKRYSNGIARTVLADFILLGTDKGSYALSKSKTDFFVKAVDGILENIAAVINRKLIPLLWYLNGYKREIMPRIKPGSVAPEDLEALGNYIEALSGAGAELFPDDNLENNLRDRASLPEKSMEDVPDRSDMNNDDIEQAVDENIPEDEEQ